MTQPKFSLGQVLITEGVKDTFDLEFRAQCLLRHFNGDWGDLRPEDKTENDLAIAEGRQILSIYTQGDKKLWVITEGDRSVTTLLLPEEY